MTIFLPLYAELVLRTEDVLEHFIEDLEVHDKQMLHQHVQPGQTWLWQVRKCGTWFTRWDQDPFAGDSSKSLVEGLIRGGLRGDWLNAQWYLVHCKEIRNGQPYGIVSGPLKVQDLADCLPRPKPQPVLPGERRFSYAGAR